MRTHSCFLALCLALGALVPAVAAADDMMPTTGTDSFRCGSHIVEMGMALDKVQQYCGEPTQQTGDRWIYERGPGEFTIVIHLQPDNTVGMIEERPAE